MPFETTKRNPDSVTIKFDPVTAYYLRMYCKPLNMTPRQLVKELVEKRLQEVWPDMFDGEEE